MFFENDVSNSYIYDATGVKLEKQVNDSQLAGTTFTYYAGNYIYKKGNSQGAQDVELTFFNSEEGYIEPVFETSSGPQLQGGLQGSLPAVKRIVGFDYIYQYKDHLGNIRLSYQDLDGNGEIDAATEIKEENHYYPFGLKHRGYNNQIVGSKFNYKTYQGQEFTEDLNLNIYEWKYRVSDPSIGRFWQIDPLAEEYHWMTTYQFASNQPIHANEIEGLENEDDKSLMNRTVNPVKEEMAGAPKIVPYPEMKVIEGGGKQAAKKGGLRLLGKIFSRAVPLTALAYTMYEIREYSADLANEKRTKVKQLQMELNSLKEEKKKLELLIDEKLKIEDLMIESLEGSENTPIRRIGSWLDKVNSACDAPFGCENVADEAVRELGEGAKYLEITPKIGNTLGPVGGVDPIWHMHVAAIKNGIVYDRLTGLAGMPFIYYYKFFEYANDLNFDVKEKRTKN